MRPKTPIASDTGLMKNVVEGIFDVITIFTLIYIFIAVLWICKSAIFRLFAVRLSNYRLFAVTLVRGGSYHTREIFTPVLCSCQLHPRFQLALSRQMVDRMTSLSCPVMAEELDSGHPSTSV